MVRIAAVRNLLAEDARTSSGRAVNWAMCGMFLCRPPTRHHRSAPSVAQFDVQLYLLLNFSHRYTFNIGSRSVADRVFSGGNISFIHSERDARDIE